ncbi:MAG TPA: hypothetical protein VMF51_08470 [Nocardioides sp.]|uniref:hypothetical protein n=1 Tax=Nocardioides sp. TaxID=35761 RepID=UPI002BAD8FD2|nr:hypothetical protein [Nocardioides sp.]HTW15150.1 hypothetical protein [Nocardioides sp.]
MGPGLHEPVARPLAALLRRAVLDHATSEPRRHYPARLHIGVPGGSQRVLALEPASADHSLRTDVAAAMLSRAPTGTEPVVWLTRSGDLDLQDLDAQWLAAALAACGEADRPLTMVVVNRHGWRDPRSGTAREWKRLRRR